MNGLNALRDFERQYATVLDVIDGLKRLRPPTGADVPKDVARWFDDFRQVMVSLPPLPDPNQLSRFGADVESAVSAVDNKANMALSLSEPKPESKILLPKPLPAATAQYQVLTANQADLTDIQFDWVRAH